MSVPFKFVLEIFNAEGAIEVQLIRHFNISYILYNGTISVFLADMSDSHGKWSCRSLNHLLLQGLNFDPVFRALCLVEWR